MDCRLRTMGWKTGKARVLSIRNPHSAIFYSNARSANPLATVVSSSPPRRRFSPNRSAKICRTAGTNEDPPVRNTLSTSFAGMPQRDKSRSTHPAIASKSGSIQPANCARPTCVVMSTGMSRKINAPVARSDKSHLVFSTARASW